MLILSQSLTRTARDVDMSRMGWCFNSLKKMAFKFNARCWQKNEDVRPPEVRIPRYEYAYVARDPLCFACFAGWLT